MNREAHELKIAMIAKMPEFDITWDADRQKEWFDTIRDIGKIAEEKMRAGYSPVNAPFMPPPYRVPTTQPGWVPPTTICNAKPSK